MREIRTFFAYCIETSPIKSASELMNLKHFQWFFLCARLTSDKIIRCDACVAGRLVGLIAGQEKYSKWIQLKCSVNKTICVNPPQLRPALTWTSAFTRSSQWKELSRLLKSTSGLSSETNEVQICFVLEKKYFYRRAWIVEGEIRRTQCEASLLFPSNAFCSCGTIRRHLDGINSSYSVQWGVQSMLVYKRQNMQFTESRRSHNRWRGCGELQSIHRRLHSFRFTQFVHLNMHDKASRTSSE